MIKASDFRSSIRRSTALRIEIRQHVQQMPFFENTEILRRDVQVLDHILTMEIKTHFILNLPRPKITTGNACATRPPLPLVFTGGEADNSGNSQPIATVIAAVYII